RGLVDKPLRPGFAAQAKNKLPHTPPQPILAHQAIMIDKWIRQTSGIVLLLIGLTSAIAFDRIARWFFFISPDGDIGDATMLELRVVLASLGVIGFYLFFRGGVHRFFRWLHHHINTSSTADFLTIVLSAGLILRVLVILCMEIPLYIDYQGYDELAWTWVQQGGYYNGEHLTGYYPVGYPFFLSRLYYLFGHAPLAGVLANIFLSLCIGWLSYRIAGRIFGEKTGRWCLLIMMFFPSQILFVNLLASEMLFTPLFLLSLLMFIPADARGIQGWFKGGVMRPHVTPALQSEGRQASRLTAPLPQRRLTRSMGDYLLPIAGGVLLGLATLTRALTQVYWLVLLPLFFLQSGSLKKAATQTVLVLAALALVVTPWIVRNHQAVGRARVSTNGGINFMIGNNPGSGMGWIEVDSVEFNTHDATREAYIDSVGWRRGWAFIRQDPVAFLKRGLLKIGYFFAGDLTAIHYQMKQAAENSRVDWSVLVAMYSQGYYIMVLLFGGFGLVVYARSSGRRPGGYLLWVTILFWTAVHFVFFGHARFHFPIMPMIVTFAALYIVDAVEETEPPIHE
ncbi:MAG: glycosyltransferase family 39 protein, partial [candidate division Zixibacteria bacterium]|nr:glycosyltransferase family 39 protein [candidate division Zixibacteria bacterium]